MTAETAIGVMKKTVKTTIVKSEFKIGKVALEIVFTIAAFCALYLTLISSLPFNAAYYAVLPIGVVAAVVPLLFFDKKYAKLYIVGGLVLFTALCVGAGFAVFKNGLLGFFNGAVRVMNETRHAGYETFVAAESFGATFLFATVVAVWLAVFSIFAIKMPYLFICVSTAVSVTLLIIGMYPQYYTAVLFVLVYVCLLALQNGFTIKAMCCYLMCAIAVSLATLPCYFFSGSNAVAHFSESVTTAFENAVYSTSIPNGRLADSNGMRDSDEVRLKLTLSRLTPTLYLRGFVGSDLNGSNWLPTDKNAYVQNGYQGLMDYIGEGNLPIMQFAEYSDLCKRNNKYKLTVENVSADRRYVYAPYTVSEYSEGTPYYDLGLRGSAFSSRTYTYTVFAADASSERVTQEQWVMEDANRSDEMAKYIKLEGQYRAFVYDTYLGLDAKTEAAVRSAVDDFETTSVNTATQFIRAYFLDAYTYADKCDSIGDSFADEFFGGKVTRANAAYFATAATCMFRALGFAARYVEGYVVHGDDSDTENATLSVDVTGNNTHAWTEVYFDGIGWLPIEVTPTFFAEQAPDFTVDPTDPGISEQNPSEPSQEQPTLPEKDPQTPVTPVIPPNTDTPTPTVGKSRLLTALEILVPIVAVIAVLMAIALAFVLRRHFVRVKRRKLLSADGVEFGRAAYGIMVHDCKHIGGFDIAALEKIGVSERGTIRFMRIAERCVYGAHNLGATEREFMLWYIESVQNALIANCGFFRALYIKYVLCVVI